MGIFDTGCMNMQRTKIVTNQFSNDFLPPTVWLWQLFMLCLSTDFVPLFSDLGFPLHSNHFATNLKFTVQCIRLVITVSL